MNGTQGLLSGPEIPIPSGAGWTSVTAALDFNDDRMADGVWNNRDRNTMAVWLMNGTQVLAAGPEIPGPGGARWTAVTAGDYNLDRLADGVWFDEERVSLSIWWMAGTQVLLRGREIPGRRGGAGP